MSFKCTIIHLQWNLSIMDLRIKDTSVIGTPIDSPKRSAIETCTSLTSGLRTPLYSVLWILALDPVPNGHIADNELYSMVKTTPPSLIASTSTAVPHGLS